MTDLCAVTVFRPFRGNQFVFATNAIDSKTGAAMVTSSMPISNRTNVSTIQIGGESFLQYKKFYAAVHQRRGCRTT
jgi:hypothetical protein